MQLFYDTDKPIRGDFIRRAVMRSDLVPVPLTLEADIRIDAESGPFFAAGRSIHTYSNDELEIVKSEVVPSGRVQGEMEAAYVCIIAILKPVKDVSFIKSNAIIKRGATLAQIYRAAGATLRGIEGDFSVSRYTCLVGEVPSYHISRALQEAGGVVRWRNGRLAFKSLASLFDQKPVDVVPAGNSETLDSGFRERHEIPAFYSLDANGAFVFGNRAKTRAVRFQQGASATTLRNMTSCLVVDRVSRFKYAPVIAAGDAIEVQGAGVRVVMTAATVFEAGVDGEAPQQYTKLWLGRLER